MSGFSDYEADQSALYSKGHHKDTNSVESKKKVRNIFAITGWLTLITIFEIIIGLFCYYKGVDKTIPNIGFIVLTLLKAGLIVSYFMHLGDEIKGMILTILIPMVLFVWFIIAFLADGDFWLHMNTTFR